MKVVKRYCARCNKERKQTKQKFLDGFARAYFGIFTLGMSELANTTYYKCLHCGKKTSEDLL